MTQLQNCVKVSVVCLAMIRLLKNRWPIFFLVISPCMGVPVQNSRGKTKKKLTRYCTVGVVYCMGGYSRLRVPIYIMFSSGKLQVRSLFIKITYFLPTFTTKLEKYINFQTTQPIISTKSLKIKSFWKKWNRLQMHWKV